jgi:hypothetical protein
LFDAFYAGAGCAHAEFLEGGARWVCSGCCGEGDEEGEAWDWVLDEVQSNVRLEGGVRGFTGDDDDANAWVGVE